MSWMDQLGGILQHYTGGGATAEPPATVGEHFDQVAQNAPQSTIADGLSAAFRSDQTPSFGEMAGQLFGHSNGQQRAGILNTILATVGPAVLSRVLSGGNGGGVLGGLLHGDSREVTPEQAEQIDPGTAAKIAAEAEKHDPSIVDKVSGYYAEHPTLVKTLGGTALAVVLASIAKNHSGLF
jgi:hypothetical protein